MKYALIIMLLAVLAGCETFDEIYHQHFGDAPLDKELENGGRIIYVPPQG